MRKSTGCLKLWLSSVAIATVLSGCTATAVVGGALGIDTAMDRRSAGAMSDDSMMEFSIFNKAQNHLNRVYLQKGITDVSPELSVVSYNRRVLLLGQVLSDEDKAYVETVAKYHSNAQEIFNHIQISGQKRTVAHITQDTLLTSQLRARLLNIRNVYAGHVKVVTFNQVVYVMGILTQQQQAEVTQVISTTPGVQRVVTLYQNYLPSPI